MSNSYIIDAIVAEAKTLSGYRAKALLNGVSVLQEEKEPITLENFKALGQKKGIGKGMLDRIQILLERGPPKPKVDFTQIRFIGSATHNFLHTNGIDTIEKLQDNIHLLQPNQRKGLECHDDLTQRIPREEVEQIGNMVLAVAEKHGMSGQIVGSFRRDKKDCGDIDVFFTGPTNKLNQVIADLKDLIYYAFSHGEHKFMGITNTPVKRSIDIRYVPPSSWGAALLFSTGPMEFNVKQRNIAISKGWTLSEYGLFAGTNLLASSTEKEIFDLLGMQYLEPCDRA